MNRQMEVFETALPGIGVRHEFVTRAGTRIGVITRRDGRRELVVYDRRDPDSCRDIVELSAEESAGMVELLGGSRVTERLGDLRHDVEGLSIQWITIPAAGGLTVLGLTLLIAGLAEEMQVSSAVGAFLVGVSLSGRVAEQGRELLRPLRDVFAGIFFVFFGLQVDPGRLAPAAAPALGARRRDGGDEVRHRVVGGQAGRHRRPRSGPRRNGAAASR